MEELSEIQAIQSNGSLRENIWKPRHSTANADNIKSQQQLIIDSVAPLVVGKTKAILFGIPDHSNRGDLAIALGELRLIEGNVTQCNMYIVRIVHYFFYGTYF